MNSVQFLFGMLLTFSLMLCSCEKESLTEDFILSPVLETTESTSLQAETPDGDNQSLMATSRSGDIVIMDDLIGLTTPPTGEDEEEEDEDSDDE